MYSWFIPRQFLFPETASRFDNLAVSRKHLSLLGVGVYFYATFWAQCAFCPNSALKRGNGRVNLYAFILPRKPPRKRGCAQVPLIYPRREYSWYLCLKKSLVVSLRGFVTPGYLQAEITFVIRPWLFAPPSSTITQISWLQLCLPRADFMEEGCIIAIVFGAIPSSTRFGE